MSLDRRVQQLEEAQSGARASGDTRAERRAERRARLAPYLADDAYFAGHREAIMAALCEATPTSDDALRYELRQTHAAGVLADYVAFSLAIVDWRTRDIGGEPVITLFVLPEQESMPDDG